MKKTAEHRPPSDLSFVDPYLAGRFIVFYAHIRARRSTAAAAVQRRRVPHAGSCCIKSRATRRIMIHCAGHESYKL